MYYTRTSAVYMYVYSSPSPHPTTHSLCSLCDVDTSKKRKTNVCRVGEAEEKSRIPKSDWPNGRRRRRYVCYTLLLYTPLRPAGQPTPTPSPTSAATTIIVIVRCTRPREWIFNTSFHLVNNVIYTERRRREVRFFRSIRYDNNIVILITILRYSCRCCSIITAFALKSLQVPSFQ